MKLESFILLITLFFLLRPFVILFHELGHAIPLLLMTNKEVIIYIGSYGNSENSFKLKIFRLTIYIKKAIFKYQGGLCVTETLNLSKKQQLLYTASGPLASVFLFLTSFYVLYKFELPDFFSITFFTLLVHSLVDIFANCIPNNNSINLYDGKIIYNDAQIIRMLIKKGDYFENYNLGVKSYNEKSFEDALHQFNNLLEIGFATDMIYRLIASCHHILKNHEQALENYEILNKKFIMTDNDYCNYATIQSKFDNHLEAIENYKKSLEINPNNEIDRKSVV